MKYLVVSVLLASTLLATGFEDLAVWPSSVLRARPMRDTVAVAWVARYDCGFSYLYDIAADLAVDVNGYVYVTGQSVEDILTLKYDSLGNQIWERRYDSGTGNDQAKAIALDAQGNIYVAGSNGDMLTIKYNPAGDMLWAEPYVPGLGAYAIVLDSASNVYVTGANHTVKYTTDCVLLWQQNQGFQAVDIALDSDDNVYITGTGGSNYTDFYTLKHSPTGTQLWVRTYNGPGNRNDYAYALAIDSENNVYVTGSLAMTSGSDPNYDYCVIKYDSSGTQIWVETFNGLANSNDVPADIGVDAEGNAVVTGFSYYAGYPYYDRCWQTIKYNSEGRVLWMQSYIGLVGSESNVPSALTTDEQGNIYITGCTASLTYYGDLTTVKYNASGEELWAQRYDCANEGDGGVAIAVDADYDVYVTGSSDGGSATYYDYVTIKYTPNFPQMAVELQPLISPVVISPFGGSFDYQVFLTNNGSATQAVQVWSELRFPNDSVYAPVLGPIDLDLAPGTMSRLRSQNVEHEWFSGNYVYTIKLGIYPDIVWAEDSILFMKRGIEGPISGTWDSLMNPYIISDSAWVPEGETLTFLPGVDIDWEYSGIKLTAYGRLEVLGTPSTRVDMTCGANNYLLLGLHGSGANADLIQYLDFRGKISLAGSDHILGNVTLYIGAGAEGAIGIAGPVTNATISNCSLEAYSGSGWPWYSASATGIYQVNGLIENCSITVAAHNSCYENISSAYAAGLSQCSGNIANNFLSVHSHNTMSDWMMSSIAEAITECSGNISQNYVKTDVEGYGRQAYGITDCNASVINNDVYLDGGQTSYGITNAGVVLNNLLHNESWNGVGISGGTTVNFNMIHGFTTMLENVPANNYHNFPDDPMVNWFTGELLTNSPCINRGDPSPIYNDPDGSRNDRGWLAFDPDSGANLVASQNALDFGQVQVGSYLDLTVIFMNTGFIAGEIERYDVSNPMYSVVSGVPSGLIAPGGTAAVVIRFAPTQVGQYIYKEISFMGSIPPYHIILHGEGL